MASSKILFVLSVVAVLFIASCSAQTTTTTSTSSTGTTSKNATTSTGTSTTGATTGSVVPPSNPIYFNSTVTILNNQTTTFTNTTAGRTIVITIQNGSLGVDVATLRIIAFNSSAFNKNPFAAPASFPPAVSLSPSVYAQLVTPAGNEILSFFRPITISLSSFPNGNLAGWNLAWYNLNISNPAAAGTWSRDATTATCTTGGSQNYTGTTFTFRVCRLGQFQVVAPLAAVTTAGSSTTGPINAAPALSSFSSFTLFVLFVVALILA